MSKKIVTTTEFGKMTEAYAVKYLESKGYNILERNYRYLKAEVDIIAMKDDVIIAVEVKARSRLDFGDPQDFVNKKKVNLTVGAMDYYLTSNGLDKEVRFDIIAVLTHNQKWELKHLENAFYFF